MKLDLQAQQGITAAPRENSQNLTQVIRTIETHITSQVFIASHKSISTVSHRFREELHSYTVSHPCTCKRSISWLAKPWPAIASESCPTLDEAKGGHRMRQGRALNALIDPWLASLDQQLPARTAKRLTKPREGIECAKGGHGMRQVILPRKASTWLAYAKICQAQRTKKASQVFTKPLPSICDQRKLSVQTWWIPAAWSSQMPNAERMMVAWKLPCGTTRRIALELLENTRNGIEQNFKIDNLCFFFFFATKKQKQHDPPPKQKNQHDPPTAQPGNRQQPTTQPHNNKPARLFVNNL